MYAISHNEFNFTKPLGFNVHIVITEFDFTGPKIRARKTLGERVANCASYEDAQSWIDWMEEINTPPPNEE